MQFNTLLLLTLATLAIATPLPEKRDSKVGILLKRAIDMSKFSVEELANIDKTTCCCCKPPSEITNVEVLHRIIAASDV